jgi:catechol-2,3-dioxygenase
MKSFKAQGLAGFGLQVPDLEAATRFYSTFGLECTATAPVAQLRSGGRHHTEVWLRSGPYKRLDFLSFIIAPGSEAALRAHLDAHGVREYDKPHPGLPDGIWFKDPWGTWINMTPQLLQAVAPVTLPASNLGARTQRVDVALWQELQTGVPLKLGHVLIFTADWEAAETFYSEVVGLRTTDRTAGKVAFMAAGQGEIDHHCFGLVRSDHRGIQHASFQVATFDDIGLNAGRMHDAGYREAFGPGRHAISSNLFHYVRDPWGSWIEYYADMDKISEAWIARDWNNRPYVWGPEWSPEFWGNEMNANLEPA